MHIISKTNLLSPRSVALPFTPAAWYAPNGILDLFISSVKYMNPATRVILIRARHGGPDKLVSSALPFINKIKKEVEHSN